MINKVKCIINKYLTRKIGAEIKCCLTFLLMLCFYCIYKWICGYKDVSIIHLLEMVCVAYVLEWIQILLHSDFDEVDSLKLKEWLIILFGSCIYSTTGYIFNWFEDKPYIYLMFFGYMFLVYLCTFLVYKIKRSIDAKTLNNDLKSFKARRLKEEK